MCKIYLWGGEVIVPGLRLVAPMGWWFGVYLNSHPQRIEDGQ